MRPGQLEWAGQRPVEERGAERGRAQKSTEVSCLSPEEQAHKETTEAKEPRERSRRNNPQVPPGLGRAPFSCQPEWKDFILQGARRRAFRRVLLVHGILQARILEWVAIPFSSGSSQPRDRTQVSDTAGGSFTIWASREAHITWAVLPN